MKSKNNLWCKFYLAISVAFVNCALAAEKTLYNPSPLPDDLVLPMPNGAEMVFRPVIVPGANFWGDSRRIIELGASVDDIFSFKQKSLVNGSFPTEDGKNWIIWIAKYELTQGQYVSVMGEKALEKNSGYERNKKTNEAKYSQLTGKNLKYEQTKPVAWISYFAVAEFIKKYNEWLFDPEHPERMDNIPKIDGVPGFVRLPTEEEWEFSARGGLEAMEDKKFPDDFPFPSIDLNKYAYFKENNIKSIKNKKLANPLGIHGMYGNVQELVSGVFRPEMTQGKPGGAIVRGGAYNSGTAMAANPALRREMDLYRWDIDNKRMVSEGSYTIGTRLAIGSNVILPLVDYRSSVLEKDYKVYIDSIKRKTPLGERNQSLLGQATIQLSNIDETLRQIVARHPDVDKEVNAIQQRINKASGQLDEAQHIEARSIIQDATRNAANILDLMIKAQNTKEFIELTPDEELLKIHQNNLDKNLDEMNNQLKAYINKIEDIVQREEKYRRSALTILKEKVVTEKELLALDLVIKHIQKMYTDHKIVRENLIHDFDHAHVLYRKNFIEGEEK